VSQARPLLDVAGLTLTVPAAARPAAIVNQVSLSLGKGETLGIAGESGCGKSTLLLAAMGIIKPGLKRAEGYCRFDGIELLDRADAALASIRGGRMALVPQNAGTALTPTSRIGAQIDEALRLHTRLVAAERAKRIVDLLKRVRLPTPEILARRYPHELSGGQLQRVAIAMALAGEPELLLLDEPTTGLDVTTQLGILDLLAELRQATGMAMVCVSHDLGVIARLSARLVIMYGGEIIEEGPTAALLKAPAHPYVRALLASIPRLDSGSIPQSIPGRPPAPGQTLPGCRYAPRCERSQAECLSSPPPLREIGFDHRAACYFPQTGTLEIAHEGEDAPPLIDGGANLLDLEEVAVSCRRRGLFDSFFSSRQAPLTVQDITLHVRKGEVLGLVGESGSGKSTILRALAGLWPLARGNIEFEGKYDLSVVVGERPSSVLRAIQLVFQNPDASLNPRQTIEEILAQPLRLYFKSSRAEVRERATALLRDVRLDQSYLSRYPGQLSGGERQRIAIARAFAAEPDVILCDEVTSALDVSVQASVLRLLRELSSKRHVACILVSHDLAVVQALSHRIAVLYRGRLVELGPAQDVCGAPLHPYTQALIAAVLEPDTEHHIERKALARDRDDLVSHGCPYAGRCTKRLDRCAQEMPDWNVPEAMHRARCFLLLSPSPLAGEGDEGRQARGG
jgi:peptide/nickel transport system ATP-binding protein